jgi:hypothetical protein
MKHKHAELMMAYAQDAMETDRPWERWEYFDNLLGSWVEFSKSSPAWYDDELYRRKGRTIAINGREIPEPVRQILPYESTYYVPDIGHPEAHIESMWQDDEIDTHRLDQGVVHLNKDAAIAHAKALTSFTTK